MERIPTLDAWDSYYVIVGSSAAALTGLQFVVMTLIGAEQGEPGTVEDVNAFGTPNVVHFCAALLVSAVLSAPWHTLHGAAICVAACGVAGLAYVGLVIRRAFRARYRPVLEDWIWHAVLPTLAYVALLVAALAARSERAWPLFAIAGASLLLVFIGIHNAWDTVIYIAVERRRKR
jgi:hypothetical protein